MTLKLRRTKKYHPRRSTKIMKLNRQRLYDLENKIRADVNQLLTLLQEGSSPKMQFLSEQTRNDLLKLGPDMQKIADELGGAFPKKVSSFLSSINNMLTSKKENTSHIEFWVDDAKIQSCYKATESLEQALLKGL